VSSEHTGGWQESVFGECVKHSELGSDRAVNLHMHNVQIIAEPTFEDN